MPYLDQILLATSANPRPGGTFDLFGGTWDTIPTPSVPAQAEFALLVSVLLTLDEARETHQLVLGITSPSGTSIGQMQVAIAAATEQQLAATPDGDRVRAESVLGARGVVFPEYGLYELTLLWDDTPLRDPLRVRVVAMSALAEDE